MNNLTTVESMKTILCTPRSKLTWNFDLTEGQATAKTTINWWSESGSIEVGDVVYEVKKHGILSGRWTLEIDGRVYANVKKHGMSNRSFDLEVSGLQFELRAHSLFSRTMSLKYLGETVAEIDPHSIFSRGADIRVFSEDYDLATLTLAFFLVTLLWRRSAGTCA